MNGSIRLISFRSMNSSGLNPFTSAAMVVENSEASKRVMGPMPDFPARIASQVGRTPTPRGVTPPSPVTTTLRMSFLPPAPLEGPGPRRYFLCVVMYWMTSLTVLIFSASSSGISIPNSSSIFITSSTMSRESAPRSSMNDASLVTSFTSRSSCSATISRTLLSIDIPDPPFLFSIRSHVHPAVDSDHLPRDVRGGVGGEKECQFGDFPRLREPAERDLGEESLLDRLGQPRRHCRTDEPGRDRVDRDVPRRELAGGRLREPDDPRLRRRVVRLPGVPHHPDDGTDVDHPAVPLLHHVAGDRLGQQVRPLEVDADDGVELLLRHPEQEIVPGDPRVVDQDVDFPLRLEDVLHTGVDLGRIAHVEHLHHPLAARGLEGCQDLPGAGVAPDVADDDGRALRAERLRDRAADPARRARDQRHLPGKPHRSTPHPESHTFNGEGRSRGIFTRGTPERLPVRPARRTPPSARPSRCGGRGPRAPFPAPPRGSSPRRTPSFPGPI